MQGLGFPGDERLQGRKQEATDHDCVDGFVRPGSVSTLSPDFNRERVGLCRHMSVANHDNAGLPLVGDVRAEDRGYAGKCAIRNCDLGTAATFLGWLKDEPYRTWWR